MTYEQLYVATVVRLHINAQVQFVLGALPLRVAAESTSAEGGSAPWTAAAGRTYFRGQRIALTAQQPADGPAARLLLRPVPEVAAALVH